LQEIYERAQLARRVAAIGKVQMKRFVRRHKLVQYRNDGARGDLGGCELSEDETEALSR
jgi:hypothetical protein